MPPNGNLRRFLRGEVLNSRLKLPSDTELRTTTSLSASVDEHDETDWLLANSASQCHTIDSVFGEPTPTKEERRALKIQKFMAGIDAKQAQNSRAKVVDDELLSLRQDLSVLLDGEIGASIRERALIERQKEALIREITYLERLDKTRNGPESARGRSRGWLFSSAPCSFHLLTYF